MLSLERKGGWTVRPVDRQIFGSFIESGFGRQVTGMWSEMIHNRAFRKPVPYSVSTYAWLGIDADHYDDRAPFWHSGYEEHDWETFGNVQMERTLGTRTYK